MRPVTLLVGQMCLSLRRCLCHPVTIPVGLPHQLVVAHLHLTWVAFRLQPTASRMQQRRPHRTVRIRRTASRWMLLLFVPSRRLCLSRRLCRIMWPLLLLHFRLSQFTPARLARCRLCRSRCRTAWVSVGRLCRPAPHHQLLLRWQQLPRQLDWHPPVHQAPSSAGLHPSRSGRRQQPVLMRPCTHLLCFTATRTW